MDERGFAASTKLFGNSLLTAAVLLVLQIEIRIEEASWIGSDAGLEWES